jgi:hypothetical protein
VLDILTHIKFPVFEKAVTKLVNSEVIYLSVQHDYQSVPTLFSGITYQKNILELL